MGTVRDDVLSLDGEEDEGEFSGFSPLHSGEESRQVLSVQKKKKQKNLPGLHVQVDSADISDWEMLHEGNRQLPDDLSKALFEGRALEILKSESVQPMTMTSSMSPFPKKKYVYITCHEN